MMRNLSLEFQCPNVEFFSDANIVLRVMVNITVNVFALP